MAKDSPQKRLAKLRKEARAEVGKSKTRRTNQERQAPRKKRARSPAQMRASAIALRIAAVVGVIALPFLLYVRSSVFFYSAWGWPPWLAVAGAITLVLALVSLYATWLARRVTSHERATQLARMVAVPMVASFLLYSLLFLARVNAKTDDVQAYYWSLHPVLRAAVSTVMIVDQTAVITDMQRAPQDYARMGLKVNSRTRHYMQADGWVHAVDIRTKGRAEPRNLALQLYFWAMGFSTLRHIGTADHLHVQLRQ